eukprot:m.100608 g.100608  ORF g.100608 m.100608 type:complete len:535 (-) comp15632_c0_seq4:119-1723(-)
MSSTAQRVVEVQQEVLLKQRLAASLVDELAAWEKDINNDDERLKKSAAIEQKLKPIRGSTTTAPVSNPSSPKRNASTKEGGSQADKKKLTRSDYAGWDKFNVDAELKKLDVDEALLKAEQAVSETSNVNAEQLLVQKIAMEEKERGNEQYKQGKYQAAIDCYTRGLEVDPLNAVLAANRAMALINMSRYREAEEDCNVAIGSDKRYVKAYQRRATARAALGNLSGAIADHKTVLELEPKNKAAQDSIADLEKKLAKEQELQRARFNPLKAAEQIMKKGEGEKVFRRIEIEEINGSDDESPLPKISAAEPAAAVGKSKSVGIVEIDSTAKVTAPSQETKSKKLAEKTQPSDGSAAAAAKQASSSSAASTSSSSSSAAPSSSSTAAKPALKETTAAPKKAVSSSAVAAATTASSKPTAASFVSTWRERQRDPQRLFEFLKDVDASALGALIKNSLEPPMLATILAVLQSHFVPAGVAVGPMLLGLSRVPRFQSIALALSDEEVKVAKDLLQLCQSNSSMLGGVAMADITAAYSAAF